jgi:non-lysosomal glucosylceramidase
LDFALRKITDYGVAFHDNGMIGYRGEKSEEAVDGQCMLILRTLRDHQMSSDKTFLVELWPKIKKAVQWVIAQDTNGDGILTGAQGNTLDAKWYGAVPWISGLYLAALRAAAEMATVAGDAVFVAECKTHLDAGQKNFAPRLINGEYFAQVPDEKHLDKVGSYDGCEIDQVLGQSWAFQVGLGRVLPEKETRSALAALWKYNFAMDVGPFRNEFKPGRWFAMPGETGTLMCSWPRGEARRVKTGFDYYFNECMNGFEHQLAGHMIWEGMVKEGLAIERAIHDRYHASKRNPWNEIECGDHYARSMASFGVYLAACGFEYDGPAGRLAFAPKWSAENFRCAFVTAEGWGTFSQVFDGTTMKASIAVKHGRLKLATVVLVRPEKMQPKGVTVTVAGKTVQSSLVIDQGRVEIKAAITIEKDRAVTIELS